MVKIRFDFHDAKQIFFYGWLFGILTSGLFAWVVAR